MAAKSRIVKWQKVRELPTKGTKGEQSAYWKWAFNHNHMNEDGEMAESKLANPDIVCEPDEISGNQTRVIMRDVIKKARLSKLERAVIELLSLGKTEEEVAKRLGIKRVSVQVYLRRARKKCEKIFVIKTRHQGDIDDQEDL